MHCLCLSTFYLYIFSEGQSITYLNNCFYYQTVFIIRKLFCKQYRTSPDFLLCDIHSAFWKPLSSLSTPKVKYSKLLQSLFMGLGFLSFDHPHSLNLFQLPWILFNVWHPELKYSTMIESDPCKRSGTISPIIWKLHWFSLILIFLSQQHHIADLYSVLQARSFSQVLLPS